MHMDDTLCRLFFLQPSCDSQRLYEALRAVFVDGCRQKDAAERFVDGCRQTGSPPVPWLRNRYVSFIYP